ncbi:hypothetical protein [Singulisphaera sp. PoT]|uniref:hypothetical protein n=1 Tax=Singulisphaera sp. PoT TaxID=3411797 RepID=UPI003BF5DF7C
MLTHTILFAYFGPETILPITSVIATVAGVALMCGKNSIRFAMRCGKVAFLRSRRMVAVGRPHFDAKGRKGAGASYRVAGRSMERQGGSIDT